jgi:phytoene dehydrogenase-like protein
MAHDYDAIVIGAGLNGLTTAAYLGKAGLKVLVLERRDLIGGSAVTEELIPGYQFDSLVSGVTYLPPKMMSDLGLARHGLEILWSDATVCAPHPDGGLTLWRDAAKSAEAIRRLSARDADRWAEFGEQVTRTTTLIEKIYAVTPPDVVDGGLADLMSFARPALGLRIAGGDQMFDSIRSLPMPVRDWLDEWFESDLLKGALAAGGIANLCQGPYSVGTVFSFLHHQVGLPQGAIRASGQIKGGMGRLADALAAVARQAGVEIRTGAEVAQIAVDDDCHATGVRLTSGEEIDARAVASSADPRRTLIGLVDATYLDPHFIRQVRNIRYRGARARVHLALGGLPKFVGLYGDRAALHGAISISPNVKYLEWAYDDAKHGRVSERPYLEAHIPTLGDPSRAPAGKHMMSVSFQFAPYHLKGTGWDEAAKDNLLNTTLDTLAEVAPDIRSLVEASHVITPLDMENTYSLTEGALYHGELMLDQMLFMRPVPGWGQYRMPIDGLFLCGAGTHPGGGLSGASGYVAAREILKSVKR